MTTLTQASLTLQTARSLRPASHPTSRSRTGASLPGTQASPRTGLTPAGHRELIAPTSYGPPFPHDAGAVPAHASTKAAAAPPAVALPLPGHKQPRRRRSSYSREDESGSRPGHRAHLLVARSTTRPGSPGAGPIRRCRFPCSPRNPTLRTASPVVLIDERNQGAQPHPAEGRSKSRPIRRGREFRLFAKGEAALFDAQASSASDRGTSAANATRMKASRLTTPMACAQGASARLSSPMPTISSATARRAPSVGPRSSWPTPL